MDQILLRSIPVRGMSVRRTATHHGYQHEKCRDRKTDRKCHHNGSEGSVLRKNKVYPAKPDSADTEHGQSGRKERYSEASQITGQYLIEKAEDMSRHQKSQPRISDRDNFGILVEDRQQGFAEKQDEDNGGQKYRQPFSKAKGKGLPASLQFMGAEILPDKSGARLAE